MVPTAEAPILVFESQSAWESWLEKHHAESSGVWLQIYKKAASQRSVTYAQALEGALCYGWIDSQKRPKDAQSWLQKFGPRRAGSGWSRINTQSAEGLIKAARMKPAGLKEVAAAKRDGRWKRAYDSPSAATIPADFLAELAKDEKAKAFFAGLNRANIYAIAYRLQTAMKPETREKRLRSILAMLARGEKFH
jgi:uncharacterized protein YdeI (YjbR/CyaY-like superfamily)